MTGPTNPVGVALDRKGNLYINDASDGSVYEATPNGTGYSVIKLAPAVATNGGGVAVGTNGLVYATALNIFRRIGTQQVFPTTPVGTPSTQIPISFSIDTAGTLGTPKLLTYGVGGQDFTLGTGSTCTGAATGPCNVNVIFTPKYPGLRLGAVQLTSSSGVAIATAPVSGLGTGPQVTQSPGTISTAASNTGTSSLALNNSQNVVVDPAGAIYIASAGNNIVYKVSGGAAASYGTGFSTPVALALDGAGNLYVAEYAGDVKVVNAVTGATSVVAGATGLALINAIAVDASGNLFVASSGNNKVYQISPTGVLSTIAGTGTAGFSGDGAAATLAQLSGPQGLGIDSLNNLYIDDTGNNRVRMISATTGFISTIAGNGTAGFSGEGGLATSAMINNPRGQIVVDAGGNVYFADVNNHRIRKITAGTPGTSVISTVAGNGTAGNTGDGDAATAAEINSPLGLFLTGNGTLYISDDDSHVVRAISPTAAPLTFGTTANPVPVGTTSGTQTVTLNNIGNTALSFPNTGAANPSIAAPFALAGGTCPQLGTNSSAGTLAAGASCTDVVDFTPTTDSTFNNFALTTTDTSLNAAAATQTVSLNGNATMGTPVVAVGSGSVVSGATTTLTATITYGGVQPTGAVTFQVGGTTATGTATCTAASFTETCTLSYTAPVETATTTLTINATVAADANYTAATNTAGNAGTLTVVPASFTAAAEPVGITAANAPVQTATLVFTSSGTLGSISIVFKGATGLDFNPAGTTPANACTVGTAYTVGQTCNVNYVFTPKRAGLRLGGITLFNNANPAQILASVYLSGIGQGPQVVVYPGNDITVATGEKQAEGLALDGSGNVYIADTFNNRVLKATLSGGAYTQAVLPFTGLNQNGSVVVDGNGNLFLTNNAGNGGAFSVAKETLVNGAYVQTILDNGYLAQGLAIDAAGNLYANDYFGGNLYRYTISGNTYTRSTIATGLNTTNSFGSQQVAVSSTGVVYVADTGNSRVVVETPSGSTYTQTTVGTGLNQPFGVAVDAGGNVYIADTFNARILLEVPSGGTYTQSVLPVPGLSYPLTLTLDGQGNLFVNNFGSNSTFKVDVADLQAVSFATTVVGATSRDSPRALPL